MRAPYTVSPWLSGEPKGKAQFVGSLYPPISVFENGGTQKYDVSFRLLFTTLKRYSETTTKSTRIVSSKKAGSSTRSGVSK